MRAELDVYNNQRYRVFAYRGNTLTREGVTVTVALVEKNWAEVAFTFWSREDAVTFFQDLALAAQITTAAEDDERPGAHLIFDRVTARAIPLEVDV